jgi:hypothetical protein
MVGYIHYLLSDGYKIEKIIELRSQQGHRLPSCFKNFSNNNSSQSEITSSSTQSQSEITSSSSQRSFLESYRHAKSLGERLEYDLMKELKNEQIL